MNAARPSSIGEILDRAIATYVRRALPLFAILAIIVIPVALVEASAQPGITHAMNVFNQMLRLPPGDLAGRSRMLTDFQTALAPSSWIALIFAVQFVLYPLANTALIFFAVSATGATPLSIGASYRLALARWMPQLGVAVAYCGILIVCSGIAGIATIVIVLAIAAVSLLARVVAVILGIIVGIAALIALFVAVSLGNVAWLMSSISIVAEDPNPVRAVGRGLRRTFDRPLFKRTVGAALAVLALDWFGTLAIVSFAGVVAYFTHIDLINTIISSCAGILLNGLCMLFVLFYMRDVQLRREGADLLAAAGDITLPA